MSFNTFKPNFIESMFFNTFHIKPYVFDNTYSLLEQIGQALEKINENIEEVNNIGEAIILFEAYVIEELSKYDQKIITDVTEILNSYISDGTLENLINQTIFGQINTNITNLTNTVSQNKTNIENTVSQNKIESDNKFLEVNNSIADLSYKEGMISLTLSPSNLIYNNGETVNGVMLNATITKGTNQPTEIKYYKNSTLINTKSTGVGLTETFLDGNIINSNTEYYVTFNDGKTITQSNKVTINFINDFLHGSINGNDTINESLIKSLTPVKVLKDNLTGIYSPNDQKVLFSYPTSYGDLTSIFDSEDYDVINAFTKSTVNLTLNSVQVSYNVYVSNDTILEDNLNLTFTF